MRRLFSSLAVFACVVAAPAPGLAEALTVPIDQSAAIALPAGSQNIMIGNPAVADLNILSPRSAVVLGRSYGVTNLLITDSRGRTILDRQIVVSAADTGRVTTIRGSALGPHLENYACSPRCERVPMPGEIDTDYTRYQSAYAGYSGRATEGRNSGSTKPGP
jgi:hypothetical protein